MKSKNTIWLIFPSVLAAIGVWLAITRVFMQQPQPSQTPTMEVQTQLPRGVATGPEPKWHHVNVDKIANERWFSATLKAAVRGFLNEDDLDNYVSSGQLPANQTEKYLNENNEYDELRTWVDFNPGTRIVVLNRDGNRVSFYPPNLNYAYWMTLNDARRSLMTTEPDK